MAKLDLSHVISALNNVLPKKATRIELHEPEFKGNEWLYMKKCLDSGYVSSVGEYVDRFEKDLAEYTGAKYAIAVVNGTAALHVCLKLVGIEKNDEVLVPALTFVATANAVAYCDGIPHFVDSEEKTLGVDPIKLESYLQEIAIVDNHRCINKHTGRRIRALIAVHTFGHPVDLDPLTDICNRFKLELIEDAAQSLGSYYKGRHTGNWGRVAALSFNGNKIMTTGGGGAVITNDKSLAARAKHITTTARVPHKWNYFHDETGFNYRMPNINAALGCAQLEQLPGFVDRKRKLAACYCKSMAGVEGIHFFTEENFARSNYWLNVLILDNCYADQRDELLELMHQNGSFARPAWTLIHRLSMFQQAPKMNLQGAECLETRLISIPSSVYLGSNC